MATYTTAWLVGSARDLDYDVIFTGNASTQTISGTAYLYHASSSLSLLAKMVTAMTAGGVANPAAVLTRDRRVKLSSSGNFSVQWSDVGLRDLLGFTGNLAAASSYTAPNVSPLLWSPAKPMMAELSPLDCAGNTRPLSYFTVSPSSGEPFVVTHGSRTDQRWSVSHVARDRMQTPDELGGEWVKFFSVVVVPGARWYWYPEVTEEPGGTATATLSGELGPYVYTPKGRAPSWDYRRSSGFQYLDRRSDLTLDARQVPEYT